jgi:uncharacterized coiled-coil protein SlyX
MHTGIFATNSFEDDLIKFKERLDHGHVFDAETILYFVEGGNGVLFERITELEEQAGEYERIIENLEDDIVTCNEERDEVVAELQEIIDELREHNETLSEVISDLFRGRLTGGTER